MKRLCSFLIALLLLVASTACADFNFDGKFLPVGSDPVLTEDSYQSANVNISVTTVHNAEYHTDITVADIYIRKLDCLRRDFGADAWGKKSLSVKRFAEKTKAPLVMSGDSSAALKSGLVVGNGEVCRNTVSNKRDVGVIWKTGEMECFTPKEMEDQGIYDRTDDMWQAFLFGPMLLKADGSAFTNKKEFSYRDVFVANPRAVIGYYEPGHYCFVLVAGRKTASVVEKGKKNYGVDMCEMSQILYDMGCKAAYNLDGGQSAVLWFGTKVITAAYKNGRPVGDAVIICEPVE